MKLPDESALYTYRSRRFSIKKSRCECGKKIIILIIKKITKITPTITLVYNCKFYFKVLLIYFCN